MTTATESLIWKGHVSHLTSFWFYLLSLLVAAGLVVLSFYTNRWVAAGAAIPLLMALGRWIEVRSRSFEITTERIKMSRGVFSRRVDELELYRVRDTSLVQPFWYRLFGRGNVVLNTTDSSTPVLVLECLPGSDALREKVRGAVEACRERKHVRYAELGGEVETEPPPSAG